MKTITFLNLTNLNKIDEIYADEKILKKICLDKIPYIKKWKKNNFNKTDNKKILLIINYKSFKENFINKKNTEIYQFLIFDLPIILFDKKVIPYKHKIYYVLPNISNPEIFIMKKDSKYLKRYWSLKNNSIFRTLFNFLSLFSIKYKLGLFLLPKVMVINE